MNRNYPSALGLGILLLAGCLSTTPTPELIGPVDSLSAVQPGESVAVVRVSGTTEAEPAIEDCFLDRFRENAPWAPVIPEAEFLATAFPEQDPESISRKAYGLRYHLNDPAVQKRIEPLNLGYLVVLETKETETSRTGGVFSLIGWGGSSETFHMIASILDVRNPENLERVKASAQGHRGMFVGPIPFGMNQSPEPPTCEAFGDGVTAALLGAPFQKVEKAQ